MSVITRYDNEDHLSECCSKRLMYYDWRWDDGVCSKCNYHSPALIKKIKTKV